VASIQASGRRDAIKARRKTIGNIRAISRVTITPVLGPSLALSLTTAGNLLTLVASARLHRLDPEAYLRDLFRVLPHWPRDRYLELAPRYWLATRTRLDAAQLERELGPLIIPGPPPSEQPPAR
jgi:transposase IS66-like protein